MKAKIKRMAYIVVGLAGVVSAACAARFETLNVGTLRVNTAIEASAKSDGGFHLTDARGITLRRNELVDAHYLGNGYTNDTPSSYSDFLAYPSGMWQTIVPDRTGLVTNMWLGLYQEAGSVDEVFVINVLVTDSANRVRASKALTFDTQAGHADLVTFFYEVPFARAFGVMAGESLKVTLTRGPIVTGSAFWDYLGWTYTSTSGYEASVIGADTSFFAYFDTVYNPTSTVALSVSTVPGTEGTTDEAMLTIDSAVEITGDLTTTLSLQDVIDIETVADGGLASVSNLISLVFGGDDQWGKLQSTPGVFQIRDGENGIAMSIGGGPSGWRFLYGTNSLRYIVLTTGDLIPSTATQDLGSAGDPWQTLYVGSVEAGGRLHTAQGANVASADEITLGTDGNFFVITGTTTINHINNTGWTAGDVVRLQMASSLTMTDTAGSPTGTEADIKITGGGAMDANDIITLLYDGTVWWETAFTGHP